MSIGSHERVEMEEFDDVEQAVAAAIEACDGDARAALKAVIIASQFLQDELVAALAATSKGYRRAG
jgi:hypothetical protein